MKPTKLSITFFVMLLASLFITMAFAFKQPNPNQAELDRLDEISARLGVIANQQADLSGQIQGLEMEYFDLNEEAIVLNDEASAIFMKLIDKKNIEIELTGTVNDYSPGKFTIEQLKQEEEWYPGKLIEDGDHQEMPELTGSESHERFKELMSAYGLDPKDIWEVEEHYGLTEGLVGCITIAETSGGKAGAGKNNIGNVGNTDSNPRGQSYSNLGASLDAIGRVLNNQYLGSHYTLACLSNAGSCVEPTDNGKRYATSTYHWQANMKACLSDIYGYEIDPANFNIRNR